MIVKFLEWLLGFFSKKTEKLQTIEKRIEDNEKKLEEIRDEKTDIDSVLDRFNK